MCLYWNVTHLTTLYLLWVNYLVFLLFPVVLHRFSTVIFELFWNLFEIFIDKLRYLVILAPMSKIDPDWQMRYLKLYFWVFLSEESGFKSISSLEHAINVPTKSGENRTWVYIIYYIIRKTDILVHALYSNVSHLTTPTLFGPISSCFNLFK